MDDFSRCCSFTNKKDAWECFNNYDKKTGRGELPAGFLPPLYQCSNLGKGDVPLFSKPFLNGKYSNFDACLKNGSDSDIDACAEEINQRKIREGEESKAKLEIELEEIKRRNNTPEAQEQQRQDRENTKRYEEAIIKQRNQREAEAKRIIPLNEKINKLYPGVDPKNIKEIAKACESSAKNDSTLSFYLCIQNKNDELNSGEKSR